MKLLNFHADDGIRAGLLRDGGVEDLTASRLWTGPAPVDLDQIATLAARTGAAQSDLLPFDDLRLAPVVLAPEKILCVGLNYRRHAAEAGMAIPETPVIFGKYANSLCGHGDTVPLPPVDTRYDYEAELAVVIGRTTRDVTAATALQHVAGYCCANDLSARGAQLATSQWMMGKMLDRFLPLGPLLVTADEVPDPQALQIETVVNGAVMQASSTGDMIFSVAEIIAFLSRHATLKAGDVIITGTPEGVQMGHATPTWLKPGDAVSVAITGLGRLSNTMTLG